VGGSVLALAAAALVLPAAAARAQQAAPAARPFLELEGERRLWQPLSFTFTSRADAHETLHATGRNPFLDHRLTLTFTHAASGAERVVQGFFAADGAAADTGAVEGNRWRARFAPDLTGRWDWRADFRRGPGIALQPTEPGVAADERIDEAFGSVRIAAADPAAPGFLAQGFLRYDDSPWFRFAGSQALFLKNGAGGPENFLAYHEFDGTSGYAPNTCLPAPERLHRYETHLADFTGDAVDLAHTWGPGLRGQAILGAINYLASAGVNSLYFLTDGVLGDGRDVWPWVQPFDKLHFDVSKLDQWERVFAHMSARGLQIQLVFEEQENDQLPVNAGGLGVGLTLERRLYYREMVARFAHHPAVHWVVGDESNYFDEVETMKSFAAELRALDPYRHPIAFHSKHPCYGDGCAEPFPSPVVQYAPYFDSPDFDSSAFQTAPGAYNSSTIQLRVAQASTRKWAHFGDEQSLNAIPSNRTLNRTKALWGNLMAGGAGIAWYPGNDADQYPPGVDYCDYFDLSVEDFRLLDAYYAETSHALAIFHGSLPFTEMVASNGLASPSGPTDYVLFRPADAGLGTKDVYALYRGTGSAATLTLGPGEHTVEWHDPRTGAGPLAAPSLTGPGAVTLPPPAQGPGLDWLAIVRQL
jgi:uncharacterized protein DUF5060